MDSNLTTVVFDKGGIGSIGALGDVGQLITWISEQVGVPNSITTVFISIFTILLVSAIFSNAFSKKFIKFVAYVVSFMTLIFLVVITAYFFKIPQKFSDNSNSSTSLQITEFSANKAKYNKNSKDIHFTLKSNKSGYCYIFTRKYGSHKWIMIFPNKYRKDYTISENSTKEIGPFKIAKYDGDEIVRAVVATKDIIDYDKTFTKDSTAFAGVEDSVLNKELEYNPDGQTKQHTNKADNIEIAIKQIKLKVDANSQDTIYLKINNTIYKADEEIDLDITTSSRGYVKIYDVSLNTQRVSFVKDEEVKSGLNKKFINASKINGRHLIVAIFNKDRFNLNPSQIVIKEQTQKGGNTFIVEFKTKKYLYDTQEYRVR